MYNCTCTLFIHTTSRLPKFEPPKFIIEILIILNFWGESLKTTWHNRKSNFLIYISNLYFQMKREFIFEINLILWKTIFFPLVKIKLDRELRIGFCRKEVTEPDSRDFHEKYSDTTESFRRNSQVAKK